jgi:PadR family transcriptional regulator, regulatory protein PadR
MVLPVTEDLRLTTGAADVLAVLLDEPLAGRYGVDLMRATRLPSGVVYPILFRLRDAGYVSADWDDVDPAAPDRPARRCYRLTPNGVAAARAEVAGAPRGRRRRAGGVGAITFAPATGR